MSRPFPGGHRRRKGLSLDGSVPGIEYNRFHAGQDRGVLDGQPQIGLPQPEQVYDRHPGRMEVFKPAYDGYDWHQRPLATPPLHMDPVEQPPTPRMSLYERGAQVFAIVDEREQEMREHSFPGRFAGCDTLSEPGGLGTTIGPLHRLTPATEISLEMEITTQKAPSLELGPDACDSLQQIIDTHFQPAPEMASALEQDVQAIAFEAEQQAQDIIPVTPEPEPEELDPYQQMMNAYEMPGLFGPMM